jgi:hypothetical protein
MLEKTRRQIIRQIELIAKAAMSTHTIQEDIDQLRIFGGQAGFVLQNEAVSAYEALYKRLVQDEG